MAVDTQVEAWKKKDGRIISESRDVVKQPEFAIGTPEALAMSIKNCLRTSDGRCPEFEARN